MTGYRESPRSYWSLLYTVAGLAVGFGLDGFLGGAIAHLAGWLIALALLLGIHALLISAVRSQKTLSVTADEIRIGDEAIARGDVRNVVESEQPVPDDVPVLGWPTGLPRHSSAVALRLTDGRQVLVPTRHPARLHAALGLEPVAAGLEIRAAAKSHLAALAEIDARADTVFRIAGYDLPDVPFDAAGLPAAKAVFVAGRPPVGFVRVDEVDGAAHIEEIAVLPGRMRRGIGSRLLERACAWAAGQGYPAITLTTYADVPWNGPFYARRGFVEVVELGPGLAAIREREQRVGLDAVGRRIAMRRELSAAPSGSPRPAG